MNEDKFIDPYPGLAHSETCIFGKYYVWINGIDCSSLKPEVLQDLRINGTNSKYYHNTGKWIPNSDK